jgi:hypothetical protein
VVCPVVDVSFDIDFDSELMSGLRKERVTDK